MSTLQDLMAAAAATDAAERDERLDGLLSETLMRDRADGAARTDAALVRVELQRLRARDAAQRQFKRETEGPPKPMDVATGLELAARALEAPRWRVEDLLVAEGSTLISAVRKSGKTTLALNLIRCLVTGEPFLGTFPVTPVTGMVAMLNFEVSGPQLGRWAAEAGVPLDRLVVASLRGHRNPLGHDDDRAALAAHFRALGVEVVIVDPFANAFTGDSQNDAGQVARFLHTLSEFARQDVGASDLVLVNHAGWSGDRSRGSSALEDWPDSIIRLTMDNHGTRFLSALGRDVDVPEGRLEFDPATRRLTLDRSANKWSMERAAKREELLAAIVAVAAETPGLGTREVQQHLRDRGVSFGKNDLSPAFAELVALGRITRRAVGSKMAIFPVVPPENETVLDEGIQTVPSGPEGVPPSVPNQPRDTAQNAAEPSRSVPPAQMGSDKGVPSVPECPEGVPPGVPTVPPLIRAGDGNREARDSEGGNQERAESEGRADA